MRRRRIQRWGAGRRKRRLDSEERGRSAVSIKTRPDRVIYDIDMYISLAIDIVNPVIASFCGADLSFSLRALEKCS
jgi:hypothetical protein